MAKQYKLLTLTWGRAIRYWDIYYVEWPKLYYLH